MMELGIPVKEKRNVQERKAARGSSPLRIMEEQPPVSCPTHRLVCFARTIEYAQSDRGRFLPFGPLRDLSFVPALSCFARVCPSERRIETRWHTKRQFFGLDPMRVNNLSRAGFDRVISTWSLPVRQFGLLVFTGASSLVRAQMVVRWRSAGPFLSSSVRWTLQTQRDHDRFRSLDLERFNTIGGKPETNKGRGSRSFCFRIRFAFG